MSTKGSYRSLRWLALVLGGALLGWNFYQAQDFCFSHKANNANPVDSRINNNSKANAPVPDQAFQEQGMGYGPSDISQGPIGVQLVSGSDISSCGDFPRFRVWQSPQLKSIDYYPRMADSNVVLPKRPLGCIYLNRDIGDPEKCLHQSYAYVIDLSGQVLYWLRNRGGVAFDFKPSYLAFDKGLNNLKSVSHTLRDEVQSNGSAIINNRALNFLGSADRLAVKPVYSLFTSCIGSLIDGSYLGQFIVLDEHSQPQDYVHLLPFRGRSERWSGSHEFLVLGKRHYLCVTIEPEKTSFPQPVMSSVVQEQLNGQALWEWRSSDYPSLYYDSSAPRSANAKDYWDYSHINGAFPDWTVEADGGAPQRQWLLSFRHLSSVLKIDAKGQKILWTLGGRSDDFGLTPKQKFSYQHTVTRTLQGDILVFDNGVESKRTRIVKYRLDEEKRRVVDFQEIFVRPASYPVSTFMGSVQELAPDTYLVCWGGSEGDGLKAPDVSIIQHGREVWTLTFLDPYTWSYRAFAAF